MQREIGGKMRRGYTLKNTEYVQFTDVYRLEVLEKKTHQTFSCVDPI